MLNTIVFCVRVYVGRYLCVHVETRCHTWVSSSYMLCLLLATFFFKEKVFPGLGTHQLCCIGWFLRPRDSYIHFCHLNSKITCWVLLLLLLLLNVGFGNWPQACNRSTILIDLYHKPWTLVLEKEILSPLEMRELRGFDLSTVERCFSDFQFS